MSDSVKFTGKITHKGSIDSGTSKAGKEWSKQELTIQWGDGEYPQSATFQAMPSDKVAGFEIGDMVTILCNFESREYNGRMYNQLKVWKCDYHGEKPKQVVDAPKHNPNDYQQATADQTDLPF